ncbi:MAG: TRAP transporter large permease [Roseitalea sp.]|jgi:C4-dicarboxylate transporter DctM subunit|nr:TRAP transporter large permease [Roseitalea sp.]MBO6720476.1 TRAP transporter large permease [Roseitalea sp.]MBO6743623.1 TRAP transporter large permease [Roseitalea sp.]
MTPFVAMLGCLVLLVALSVPLAFALILSCAVYLFMSGNSLTLLIQQLFSGLDIFTIMAIPFFMLAGDLMVSSGTADRLLRFAQLLVGRLRGGTGYVNIVASMLFGGCSGSAIADIAALGRTQVSMMEKSGFSREFSSALTLATSIQGAIIPPSIPIVLVGAVSGTSIGGMLIGGIVPGLLVGLALAIAVYWTTRHNAVSAGGPMTGRQKLRIVLESIPFLMMPVIILGGILSGVFTPTEASAAAVAWGFGLWLFEQKGRPEMRQLFRILLRSGTLSAAVLLLTGAANVFSWILATEQVPAQIAAMVFSITDEPILVLLIIMLFLLLWGMVMDMLPAIFIVIPILLPLAAEIGVDPVHFGVICTFNLVIGLITPPYGTALFTGSIVLNMPIEKIVRHILPFFCASVVVMLIITFVPETVLFLPRALDLL